MTFRQLLLKLKLGVIGKQANSINARWTGVVSENKSKLGMWIGIGVALGAGIGVAMDNIALGIGIGIAMGAAIGLWQRRLDDGQE